MIVIITPVMVISVESRLISYPDCSTVRQVHRGGAEAAGAD
jgi:hypothetical protein